MASPGSGSGSGILSNSKVAATQPETNQEHVGMSKTSQTSQERLPKTKSTIEPNTPEKFRATANPGKDFVSEQSTASYTGAPNPSLKKPSHNLSVASNASELPKEQHAASISTSEQNNQGPLYDLSAATEDVESSRETGVRSRATPSGKNVSLDLPLNSDACKASNEPRSSASSASKRSNNGPSSSLSAISTNCQASKDLPPPSSTLRPNSKQSFRHHVASKQIRASTSSFPQASLKGKMPAQNPVSVASQDINHTAASSSRPSITERSSVSTSTSTTPPNRNLATNQPQPVAQMEAKRALPVTAGHDDEEKLPSVCQQIVDFFLCRPCCRGQGCCGKNGCIAACDCKGCCCSCC